MNRGCAILLRVVCVLVLSVQSSILDYYLLAYITDEWYSWTITLCVFDIIVVAMFISALFMSYRSVTPKTQ